MKVAQDSAPILRNQAQGLLKEIVAASFEQLSLRSFGTRSLTAPARVSHTRSRVAVAAIDPIGITGAMRGVGHRLDLQLHQALRGKTAIARKRSASGLFSTSVRRLIFLRGCSAAAPANGVNSVSHQLTSGVSPGKLCARDRISLIRGRIFCRA